MTIQELLQDNTKFLKNKKIKISRQEIEILLAHILKYSREYLITNFDKNLSNVKIKLFKKYINRRVRGESIAYITKHKEFYGLDFSINKNVLVPRPETELMVDEILKEAESLRFYKNHKDSASSCIMDIGTGSGCIIITLAKKLKKPSSFNFFASDTSLKALYVARKNAKFHNVNKQIKKSQGDLLKPILNNSKNYKYFNNPKNHIIIVANLPYLTPKQFKSSPSIQKEPKLALIAGNDGLKYYRELFNQIKNPCLQFCKSISIYIEIDHSQKTSISKLIKKELPQAKFQIKKDLRGYYRLVCIKY